jgi:uncharacterized membrane protein
MEPKSQASTSRGQKQSSMLLAAAELSVYEEALPGSAERVLAMVEKQQEHEHELASEELAIERTGQVLAFAIAVLFLAAATLMVLLDYDAAGTIIGTVDLVALVTVFVVGRSKPVDQ